MRSKPWLLVLLSFACLALTAKASAVTRTGVVERAHYHQSDGSTKDKLSEAASVRFTVQRPKPGRKAGKRCVAPTLRIVR